MITARELNWAALQSILQVIEVCSRLLVGKIQMIWGLHFPAQCGVGSGVRCRSCKFGSFNLMLTYGTLDKSI